MVHERSDAEQNINFRRGVSLKLWEKWFLFSEPPVVPKKGGRTEVARSRAADPVFANERSHAEGRCALSSVFTHPEQGCASLREPSRI